MTVLSPCDRWLARDHQSLFEIIPTLRHSELTRSSSKFPVTGNPSIEISRWDLNCRVRVADDAP